MNNTYRENVLALIINAKGEVLIGQNTSRGRDWTFPKGGIKLGENKIEALFREIYEETGILSSCLEIIYQYKHFFQKDFSEEEIQWKIQYKNEYFIGKKDYIFVCYFNESCPIDTTITNELENIKWIKLSQIQDYITNQKLLNLLNISFLERLLKYGRLQ